VTTESAALQPAPSGLGRIRISTLLLAVSAGICVQVLVLLTLSGGDPVDALSYWMTDPSNPYPLDQKTFQFGYSPVIAQLWAPLFQLPFAVFAGIFRVVEIVCLVFLTGPLAGALIFTTPVASEINAANINMLLAVVMVLGFRWPALWAIPLLTKPSMGVGLVWFLVRGEWRKAAIPIALAGALALVSFVFDPRLWFQWVEWVQHGTGQVGEWPYPYPIQVRLPIALVIVVWAARTNRPWAMAFASALALPRLYYQSPAILVAMIPLIPWLGRLVVPWVRRIGRLDELTPDRAATAPEKAGPRAITIAS
jgi:hypothetical protein